MAALEWSDALALDLPLMDDTHREFVDLLAQVEQADDATVVQRWQELVDHTEHHFGQEDAWMVATRFASGNCHTTQHKVVLQVMREGIVRAEQGDLQPIRIMTGELAQWFPQHAQMMDASLALHLRRVGFDPATGVVHAPDALPAELIQGCGSTHSCVDHPEKEPAEANAAQLSLSGIFLTGYWVLVIRTSRGYRLWDLRGGSTKRRMFFLMAASLAGMAPGVCDPELHSHSSTM